MLGGGGSGHGGGGRGLIISRGRAQIGGDFTHASYRGLLHEERLLGCLRVMCVCVCVWRGRKYA